MKTNTHTQQRERVAALLETGRDMGKHLGFRYNEDHVRAAAAAVRALEAVRDSTESSYVQVQALIRGFMEGANIEAVPDPMSGGHRFRTIERAPRPTH